MKRRIGLAVLVTLAVAASLGVTATGRTLADFARVLESIPIVQRDRVLAAVSLSLAGEGFPESEMYGLLERLAATPGAAAEKETIVLVLAYALEQGIPIDGLLSKASEGLARGVQLGPLGQLLDQRLRLLVETRDLFYAKGVFRAAPGTATTSPTTLPAERFDALLTQVGDALGDYLESGGSPFNGELIHREVENRLTKLRGGVLPASDVDLILPRIGADDLTRIVQTALG
ncbi:MAG: hypothetical protein AB1778_05955 [Candidatus Bipolaricaulota bacterium]